MILFVPFSRAADNPHVDSMFSFVFLFEWSPMRFAEGFTGDSEKTIQAAGRETWENASFLVIGRPLLNYLIFYPSEIYLNHEKFGTLHKIKIDRIHASPERQGRIGLLGTDKIYFGATREALKSNLAEGNYRGELPVTVISQ